VCVFFLVLMYVLLLLIFVLFVLLFVSVCDCVDFEVKL